MFLLNCFFFLIWLIFFCFIIVLISFKVVLIELRYFLIRDDVIYGKIVFIFCVEWIISKKNIFFLILIRIRRFFSWLV